jgi:hypothetical protein
VPDPNRPHNVKGLTTADELKLARRELPASLTRARPDSSAHGSIMAYRGAARPRPGQGEVTS